MEFDLEAFMKNPTWEVVNLCKKADLIQIANQYGITVTSGSRKNVIKQAVVTELLEKQILTEHSKANLAGTAEESASDSDTEVKLKQLDVKLKLEQIKYEQMRMQLAHQQRQSEQEQTICLKELEIEELRIRSSQSMSKEFGLAQNSRLVPPFNEKEVDKYFTLFERVADTLKWPEEFRPLLLQSVLVGKAQRVYASLSVAQSSDYRTVKETILRSYKLVPEAYRQQF